MVKLINPFEIPEGEEEEFLARWREAAEYLRHQPGFISTKLHRSLDSKAKFRFVNVAEWESPQYFQAALRSDGFQQLNQKMHWVASPGLYNVVVKPQEYPPKY